MLLAVVELLSAEEFDVDAVEELELVTLVGVKICPFSTYWRWRPGSYASRWRWCGTAKNR